MGFLNVSCGKIILPTNQKVYSDSKEFGKQDELFNIRLYFSKFVLLEGANGDADLLSYIFLHERRGFS